jgi:DHA2 family methylenomycin A resistance protein-like MFS transporter
MTPDKQQTNTAFVLAVMCLGTFMAILDTSLVNLGLHAISRDLRAEMATLQWVIDLYNLTYAAFILSGGALADIYGRRRIFVSGCVLFAAGSTVCAAAPNAAVLIIGRGIAGLGAALELPAALAILNVTYADPAQRTRAIAVWGGMNGLAMAIGPSLGGVLVDFLGWRSLFVVVLPVAAAAVWLGMRWVPETRDTARSGIDLSGQALAVLVLGTLSLGFIEGPSLGWRSAPIVACFGLCVVGLSGFVAVERRAKAPLVPLETFRSRPFTASIVIALLMTFGMYGMLFVLPLYFQAVQGLGATGAGLRLLPMSVVFFLVSLFAGRVAPLAGARLQIGGGMGLTGAGLAGLYFVPAGPGFAIASVSLLAIGVGLGLITGPIATVAVANAPAARSGMSSGLVNMGRLVGATLGVAVLGVMFGAHAGNAVSGGAGFLTGLRASFTLGASAEFLGVVVAALWLRGDSLGGARLHPCPARVKHNGGTRPGRASENAT